MIHACPDCGLVHDTASTPAESPEVAIARIQADSALAIAKLQARADAHVAEVAAEGAVDAVEAEGEADVAVAEVIAPELGDMLSPPDDPAAPVVIEAPPAEAEPDDELAPPEAGHEHDHEAGPEPARKHRGLGLW